MQKIIIMMIIRTDKTLIICLYISPAQKTDDAVEHLMKAITMIKSKENVIFRGDLNCRINKTGVILELLWKRDTS